MTEQTQIQKKAGSPLILKIIVWFAIVLLVADFIYKSYFGITYQTRENCIIYQFLPRWAFMIYEFFIELVLVVIAGIFVAVVIEKHFYKMKRFLPKNQFSAFFYASLIPVCSCSAIPLVKAMEGKVSFRTIVTFVVAAPLLNPYIIVLSFTVLGKEYGILRIASAFVVAYLAGIIMQLFIPKDSSFSLSDYAKANKHSNCIFTGKDIYDSTFKMLKSIWIYLLIAGVLSATFEIIQPAKLFEKLYLNHNVTGNLMAIVIGVPIYFCNGADVVFIKPFVQFSGLPLGTALSFSLTSTAVCISSIVLLIKFIGRKLTFILTGVIVLLTFVIGVLVNLLM